jgi:hypothetical protein
VVARSRDIGLSIAILLFALAYTGLRIYSRAGRGHHALGTVVLTGTSLGSTQFTIDDCKKLQFDGPSPFGADLVGSGKYDMRLVRYERGDVQVSLYPKGNPGAAIPIDPSRCSQWEPHFFSESASLAVAGGGVDFTCPFAGGKIDGTIFADRCRLP